MLAVAIAALLTVVAALPVLPPLLQNGGLSYAFHGGGAAVVTLLYLCVAAYAAVVTRGRTVLNPWLVVVLLASTIDIGMTALGGGRYTAGWYVGRLDAAFASGALLTVFLLDFTLISRRLAMLASLDVVSGLANRRALDERLDIHVGNRRRHSEALSLIMLDIDHFKAFNDRYGHAAGDECLRAVADIVRRALARGTDFAARYGGEEFVVVLPATDRDGAIIVAERIRSDVERLSMVGARTSSPVTISLGVVTVPAHAPVTLERVLRDADRALYAAKAAGRNCIAEANVGVQLAGNSTAPA